VVDDSIVRGNTQRALVRMLREAGAVEVHVRIASPPVKWPCFYGIDFATPAELIANAVENEGEMLEAVRHAIGADTLGYVSQHGMIAATEQPASRLCTACFDGNYPIELPGETALGKNVIEHMLATAARTGIRVSEPEGRRHSVSEPEGRRHSVSEPEGRRHSVQADNDNVSALRRP
jgi:amidophosphoribosyltransferase